MAKRKILTRNNCTIKLEKHSAINNKNGQSNGKKNISLYVLFSKEYSYVVKRLNIKKYI